MNTRPLSLLYLLAMPGGLLLAASALIVRFSVLPASASSVLPWLPYAVFAASALLSWRFNKSRLLWAAIVLTLVYGALSLYILSGSESTSATGTIFAAVALLVPMNLVGFSLMEERGTTMPVGLLWSGLIFGQLIVVAALCRPELGVAAAYLQRAFIPRQFLQWTRFPQPALVVFVVASIVLVVRFCFRPKPLEGGFFWALISLFIALNGVAAPQTASLYFSTAGLILLVSLVEMSYHMAFRDELTGLPGRRAFNEAALKLGDEYSVAMVDVDHFKKFNDTYGHDCGDQVLRMVGSKLENVSGGGRAFRYGGEEFAVIFSDQAADDVIDHLEQLRHDIETAEFVVRGPERRKKTSSSRGKASKSKQPKRNGVQITVSIGVADRDRRRPDFDKVIRAADKALYRAKEAGRNRVEA
ncbi:MAG TPA: GGDEF domain-containing protein [Candidatus Angelobacter sp.]|nr:GGDEF domain-containing protein [Candidatus Angelobacter sp.]